jgi:hypothetical protein
MFSMCDVAVLIENLNARRSHENSLRPSISGDHGNPDGTRTKTFKGHNAVERAVSRTIKRLEYPWSLSRTRVQR